MSVFVSGANGFIAQHIVDLLLKEDYKVIGSARSQEKAENLTEAFGNNPKFSMEVVPDISKLDAFDHVFQKHGKDIKIVLHTASPFCFDITDSERDLLIPAVNGVKGILHSIKKYAADSVERVVLTSSYAAVFDMAKENDKSLTFNEESWNPATWESCQSDPVNAYCGSKKFAEKAAWEFLEENRDSVKFELTAVNPVYVFGPQMFDKDVKKHLNTSCELVNSLMHLSPEGGGGSRGVPHIVMVDAYKRYKGGGGSDKIPELFGGYIDVRDVAKAHLVAFQKRETIGQRLIVSEARFTMQDVLDILNEDFPVLKGNIPVGKPGSGATHNTLGATLDNKKSKKLLGFKFRNLKETIDDTASQILKFEGRIGGGSGSHHHHHH
nr:Gre2p-SpyTag003 Loop B [synthetic construct]